jgi:hypothetical protein
MLAPAGGPLAVLSMAATMQVLAVAPKHHSTRNVAVTWSASCQ